MSCALQKVPCAGTCSAGVGSRFTNCARAASIRVWPCNPEVKLELSTIPDTSNAAADKTHQRFVFVPFSSLRSAVLPSAERGVTTHAPRQARTCPRGTLSARPIWACPMRLPLVRSLLFDVGSGRSRKFYVFSFLHSLYTAWHTGTVLHPGAFVAKTFL